MNILVTGANGQLGTCLQRVSETDAAHHWVFASSAMLNIADAEGVRTFFEEHPIDVVVNCAAYTAVDKAESEPEKAEMINAEAVRILAENCLDRGTLLIHISTDFVFDGTANTPYKPSDVTHPLGVYGVSKRAGEAYIEKLLSNYFIIRTSWVYSEFGNNFMKTMLRLSETRDTLNVVEDQTGSPTYAMDLARFIVTVINAGSKAYGTYHYCNAGTVSWFGFASAICKLANRAVTVNPIPTSGYPTPAQRPAYSVLDTHSSQETFHITIPLWQESLEKCLNIYLND